MYPNTNYQLNGTGNLGDVRLEFANLPNWKLGGRQHVTNTEYEVLEPISKISGQPTHVEFELPKKKSILFGPNSKFFIKGIFQVKAKNENDWKNATNAEVSKVLLPVNWFEMLIKDVVIFNNDFKVASSTGNPNITPFLNAYLYTHMEPTAKRLLCPQDTHPAYCVPEKNEKWGVSCNGWSAYGKKVFNGGAISWEYIPMFLFPFYQGSNFMMDQDGVPRVLHAPILNRFQIRFIFHDSFSHIFNAVEGNDSSYRFVLLDFKLMVEQVHLNPAIERPMQTMKKQQIYHGVTRLQYVEPIPNAQTLHKIKFQDITLPEGLFIFALDKSVASGSYKFSAETRPGNVFRGHNIKTIDLSFNGQRFFIKEPHMGCITRNEIDSKVMFDHIFNPPFGIRQDLELLTRSALSEGATLTAFAHVYLPLTTGPGDRKRIVPVHDNGSSVLKKADLDIEFRFTTDNSPDNTIYVVYAFYTDANMIFDPKNRMFYSPYLEHMH